MNESASAAPTQQIDSVEPILQFCILCDSIVMGPGAKPTFIGVFISMRRPATVPQFYVALRWIRGKGEHTFSIKILDPDLEPIFTSEKAKIILSHNAQTADGNYGLVNLQFAIPGVYWIEIFLNGETHTAIPLPVYEAEEPAQAQ